MTKKIFDSVTRHSVLYLIASLIFALPFIAFSPFVKTVNNVDYFTLENDPDVEFHNNLKEIFGNDEFLVIAFGDSDIFTAQKLGFIRKITEELENLKDVRDVISLYNADDIIGSADYFEVKKFLDVIPETKEGLSELKKRAINNSLYRRSLISCDGRTASIVVFTYNRPDDENYRMRLITEVEKILDPYRGDLGKFHLAGWTMTNLRLSQYMKKDVSIFIPISYLMIALTILVVFRSIKLTLLAVANISVCMASTMGLFGLTGITLNNVTSIVPPLVMALSLADTVHIFSHMEKKVLNEFPDRRQALASVLRRVVFPCFMTSVTTAIGFFSLSVSSIPPIKEFAYVASAGMVFQFIYSFFFMPPLILLFSPEGIYRDYSAHTGLTGILSGINKMLHRHYKTIFILSCIVILAAFWFAAKIRSETNTVEFFKASSPFRASVDFVEKRLSGVASIDISFKAREDAFKEPENLLVIDSLQSFIKTLEGVDVTTSFVDFIKDMNESFYNEDHSYYKIPENRAIISQYLLLYDSDDIDDFINDTYDHARLTVRISEHGSAAQARLIEKIQKHIEGMEHPGLDIRISGRAVHDVNMINALVKGQLYSLSLAAGIICIIMFLIFRSLVTGLLSLVPNLFPIILNFGIMGAVGIPLDTGTALIAAVALGIAVDDTIHFLSEYNKLRVQKIPISRSVEMAIFNKGRAIVSTSIILSIGFGVSIFSSFVPIINFAILSAIIIITALIGDIIVLPSVLLLKKGSTQ